MKYTIDHKTYYQYVAPVVQSHHILHLTPRIVPHQVINSHSLIIEPAPASRMDYVDYNGNPSTVIIIEQEHAHLQFSSHSEIILNGAPASPPANSPSCREISQLATADLDLEVQKYSAISRHTNINDAILAYARKSLDPKTPIHLAISDLTARVFKDFTFDNTATDVSTPISKVLEMKRGVCQDFAHLQIACARALGIPARYVSGYILTRPPEGQKKLAGTDATHAWVSIWFGPDLGWVDFDPTNNMIPQNEHITFAYGADFDDVSPISGVLIGGGNHSVAVAVDVIQHPDP